MNSQLLSIRLMVESHGTSLTLLPGRRTVGVFSCSTFFLPSFLPCLPFLEANRKSLDD